MKYLSTLISLFIISVMFVSCGTENSKTVIATAGNEDITLGEFERAYEKNSGESSVNIPDSASLLKFWNLYKNFRLKLVDAKAKGYENDKSLSNELIDYKKKVGVSYLLEKQLLDPGVKDIYNKRKIEYRVSHIMIRLDSLSKEQAKERAWEVIKKFRAGAKFEDLAKEYSDDTYSKNSGGDIYYITFGQTLPEFDEAVYQTQVDSIYPQPIETKFGYHVVKVTDKQNRKFQVRVKHILLDYVDSVGNVDSIAAKLKMEEIRKNIIEGKETFEDAATKYSEDKGSAEKGGDLGFFERRSMILPFDQTAFSLKPDEISQVVQTRFGYHLIKFVEEKPYPTYEEEKTSLRTLYKRSLYDSKYNALISELKTKYGFSKNDANIKAVLQNADSVKISNDYFSSDFRNSVKEKDLFTINNNKIGLDSVIAFVINDTKFQNKIIDEKVLNEIVDETAKNALLEQRALTLENEDAEFATLMNDYKQGIFIFKIQEDEIWNKIKLDSAKLVDFYQKTKENYQWKNRVDFGEIFSKKDSLINSYYAMLQSGASFDSLAKKYTERIGYKAKSGAYGYVDVESNELAKYAFDLNNAGDYSKPITVTGGFSIIKMNNKRNAGIKSFEEAKAEVASIYQEKESKRLEDEYINNLNVKYPINNFKEDVLFKAFKSDK
ncbi:MAG: peptidylprolyl isomerase [bacterium]